MLSFPAVKIGLDKQPCETNEQNLMHINLSINRTVRATLMSTPCNRHKRFDHYNLVQKPIGGGILLQNNTPPPFPP